MKKILSLVLSLTICASLAAPAIAAEEITPEPPLDEEQISGEADPGLAPDAPGSVGDLVTDSGPEGEGATETPPEPPIEEEIPDVVFSDVPEDHTFYKGIMYCAGKGIVNGYDDNTFRPANTVTKSHFCAMLARAFYANLVAKYDTEQCKQTYGTFGPTNLALASNGTLDNTSFRWKYANASAMATGINRYDMAQMMTNIMTAKGFAASASQKTAVQSKIMDYKNIPSQYQDAVKNVYALGIITGYKDGSFVGTNIMNRGQAAIVIQRMAQYAPAQGDDENNQFDDGTEIKPEVKPEPTPDPKPIEPTPEPKPEVPEAPKATTVTVTNAPYKGSITGTEWFIKDNKQPNGYLANGKPITETNVLAMLADAKQIWTEGMQWGGDGAGIKNGNNMYSLDMSSSVGSKCALKHRTSSTQGCGAFAAMLSDYVFGPSSNPVRKLSDNTQVRPGDIVFRINPDGSVAHVNIAMTTVGKTNGGNPGIRTANGNSGGTVNWRDTAANYTDRIDDYQRTAGMSTCIIYTRYPD